MKISIKNKLSFFSIIIGLLCITTSATAKDGVVNEKSKTIVKEFDVTESTHVKLEHDHGTINVKHYNESKGKVEVNIVVTGEVIEDLETILSKYSINIKDNGNTIDIASKSNIKSWMKNSGGFFSREKHHLKFADGTEIKSEVNNLESELTIWLPRVSKLSVKNEHDDIYVNDWPYALDITIYDGDLTAGDITGDLELKMKHSNGSIENIANANLDLYDSTLKMKNGNKIQMKSKHSNLDGEDISSMDMEIYDTHIELGDVNGRLDIKEKHSTIRANIIGDGKWNMYDSKVNIKEAGSIEMLCKHGNYEIYEIKDLKIRAYDVRLNAERIGSLNSEESKHSHLIMDYLEQSIDISNGYDMIVKSSTVSPQFEQLIFEGKHSTLNIPIPSSVAYDMDIQLKHGDITYDEDKFDIVKHVEKEGKIVIEANAKASTSHIVRVKGDDIRVNLKN